MQKWAKGEDLSKYELYVSSEPPKVEFTVSSHKPLSNQSIIYQLDDCMQEELLRNDTYNK